MTTTTNTGNLGTEGKAVLFRLIKIPFLILLAMLKALLFNPGASLVFWFAVLGAFCISDSKIGDIIQWTVTLNGTLPPEVPLVVAVILFIFVSGDLGREFVPERFAIYLVLPIPACLLAIPKSSGLYKDFSSWVANINTWLDVHVGGYIGGTAQSFTMNVISVLSILVAIIWNEKYGKGRYGTNGTTATTISSTPTPPRTTRRSSR